MEPANDDPCVGSVGTFSFSSVLSAESVLSSPSFDTEPLSVFLTVELSLVLDICGYGPVPSLSFLKRLMPDSSKALPFLSTGSSLSSCCCDFFPF